MISSQTGCIPSDLSDNMWRREGSPDIWEFVTCFQASEAMSTTGEECFGACPPRRVLDRLEGVKLSGGAIWSTLFCTAPFRFTF